MKAFTLFVLDVGLLSCMTGLGQRTLLDGNQLFVDNGNRIIPGEVKAAINLPLYAIGSKLFLRDGGSDDEASGKTAAFMQITHSPGFKESNVCKLHFLWIISSAKQHNSSANVMDKPFAELSKLFNVIFGIHFFPIPRVGRCLQNGLMIGTAL